MTNQNITTFNEISNPITSFNFNSMDVRVITKDNEPWFVLNDVCKILELSNASKSAQSLDSDEKMTLTNSYSQAGSGAQHFIIINESGLYSLILRSRKPEAKRFKKWVTSEVLPSIRKTGSYSLSPSQYGGITKGIVNKAIAPLQSQIETLVDRYQNLLEEISIMKTSYDPSAALVTHYRPIISVLLERNVPQKGRRILSCRCSGRIHRYLIRVGKPFMIRLSRETSRYIYHVDGIKEWLEFEGNYLIQNHIDKVMGQGRLHLVGKHVDA